MDKIKQMVDNIEDVDVIASLKQEFKEQFPDTPESSPDKEPPASLKDYES